MERIASFDGTRIAYCCEGEGPAVLLLHGFAASHANNWRAPGVIRALVAAGRRVIATDARGHGDSDKPHEPAAYDDDAMVHDARAVLDHLAVEEVDVVGYSMGAMIAARLVPNEPRTRSLVLAGLGGDASPPRRGGSDSVLAAALTTDDPASISSPMAKGFRRFADATGADRLALAAIELGNSLRSPVRFDAITVPTLVLAGESDELIAPPQELAGRLPNARLEIVPGDHLGAPLQPEFTQALLRFLTRG
jgi:pimeloyl-ACP methyl ester carboxylesterase